MAGFFDSDFLAELQDKIRSNVPQESIASDTSTGIMSREARVTEEVENTIPQRVADNIKAASSNPVELVDTIATLNTPRGIEPDSLSTLRPLEEVIAPNPPSLFKPAIEEYVPAVQAVPTLSTEPVTEEAVNIITADSSLYEDYTRTTSAGYRDVADIEGIVLHYTHGSPRGSTVRSYSNAGLYGYREDGTRYHKGQGRGTGAPFFIDREGTIHLVGDWRNAMIQHVSSSSGRVVQNAPRTLSGARLSNANSIGIEIDVGWNYDGSNRGHGRMLEGEANHPTQAQIEAVDRLQRWLLSEVNNVRNGEPLTLENAVFAHPELQRDKQPVEATYALQEIRQRGGLAARRTIPTAEGGVRYTTTDVPTSLVPRPRPSTE